MTRPYPPASWFPIHRGPSPSWVYFFEASLPCALPSRNSLTHWAVRPRHLSRIEKEQQRAEEETTRTPKTLQDQDRLEKFTDLLTFKRQVVRPFSSFTKNSNPLAPRCLKLTSHQSENQVPRSQVRLCVRSELCISKLSLSLI